LVADLTVIESFVEALQSHVPQLESHFGQAGSMRSVREASREEAAANMGDCNTGDVLYTSSEAGVLAPSARDRFWNLLSPYASLAKRFMAGSIFITV
jgi:hypothetical protein